MSSKKIISQTTKARDYKIYINYYMIGKKYREDNMKTHIKILGWIYTILACLTFGIALISFIISVSQEKLEQNALVISIFTAFGFWWLKTGLGLLSLRRGIKLHALIVAVVFMSGLNALFLISGGETFRKPGWVVFHVTCISIGIYTLVVLFLPKTDEVWQIKKNEKTIIINNFAVYNCNAHNGLRMHAL